MSMIYASSGNDDTLGLQTAIVYCESFTPPKPLTVVGACEVSATLTISKDQFRLRMEGPGVGFYSTISDGSPCLKVAAGCGSWDIEANFFGKQSAEQIAAFHDGSGGALNCVGFEAYQTGSDFITRFRAKIFARNLKTGVRLGAFIGDADVYAYECETGLEGALLNAVEMRLKLENCRKDFSIEASHGFQINALLAEGSVAASTTSTIDGCHGFSIISPYWEWSTNARIQPFLTIGGVTECRSFAIENASLASGNGVAFGVDPILLDQVDTCAVSGEFAEGTRRRSVGTTTRSKGVDLRHHTASASWLHDTSRNADAGINYFPNSHFDLWFRGWASVSGVRAALSRETELVRRGANAVRITATAGTKSNYGTWLLKGSDVAAMRGKTVRVGMWVFVPDLAAFDEAAATMLPAPVLVSSNGSASVTSAAINNRAAKGLWNFMHATVAVQIDASDLRVSCFVNQSDNLASGHEFVAVDSITLVESSVPLWKQREGLLRDTAQMYAIGVGGRMVAYANAPPTDVNQIYASGDQVWNAAPAPGVPPGWMCTTGGPGGAAVFKAMANLSV